MYTLGIIYMTIGVTFGVLHIINRDTFGIVTAGLAFISGLVTVLIN